MVESFVFMLLPHQHKFRHNVKKGKEGLINSRDSPDKMSKRFADDKFQFQNQSMHINQEEMA
jgi:hypothetical protein